MDKNICYVNMDKKLIKTGGRKFSIISKQELKEKLYNLCLNSEESCWDNHIPLKDFYLDCQTINLDMLKENRKIENDLSKIYFGGDEFFCSKDDNDFPEEALIGLHTLENGLTFLGCMSCGDEEYTLFFIIYWDGSSLRGYIPSYGNTFNIDFHTAFGSEYNTFKDYETILNRKYLKKNNTKNLDSRDILKIYKDIHKSINPQFNIDVNWNAVKLDILNRIEVN